MGPHLSILSHFPKYSGGVWQFDHRTFKDLGWVFNDHGNTSQAKRTIELKFMEFSSIFQLAIRSWDHPDHAKSDDEMDCQESSMIIRTDPDPSACASGAPRRRAQHLLNRHGLGRDHVTKKAIRCDQAQLSQRAADDSEIHEVCSILLVKPT